jgi:hypothetical protein
MPEIKNFQALCKNLAVEMTARTGELWRVMEYPEHWTHIESRTACLQLRDDWRTHRLAIHATAPANMREKTTGETITADPNRKAEAIARDIESRILTHARAHLAESKAYDTEKMHEEAAAHLRESIMSQFTQEKYNGKLYKKSKDRNRRMWIEIVNYDNSATIEIHLPFADALRLAKHIEQGEYIK